MKSLQEAYVLELTMKLPVQQFPCFACIEKTRKSHAHLFLYNILYLVIFMLVHCCQETLALVRREANCRCYKATMSKTGNRAHCSLPEDPIARTPVVVHVTFAKSFIFDLHRISIPSSKGKILIEEVHSRIFKTNEEANCKLF